MRIGGGKADRQPIGSIGRSAVRTLDFVTTPSNAGLGQKSRAGVQEVNNR